MGKNIILCSDGTGNRGGETPDTNVYKIYNAIKLQSEAKLENPVTFYDNGVGTSKNTLMKALGSGVGVGFRENICDLYEFLGRNYNEGDNIYIFGFSRGAATVRAFAGMIEHCGLVDKSRLKTDDDLKKLTKKAFNAYQKGKLNRDNKDKPNLVTSKDYPDADTFRIDHSYTHKDYAPDGKLKIEFMGVWDTVSSLGTPQIEYLDTIINWISPHKFYDLEPENCVKNVYHAIAVDDERRTFWPLVWNENSFYGKPINKEKTIEQVWFPGMHSNVGGGYHRQELANVTLDWMIERINIHALNAPDGGLDLKHGVDEKAKEDANPFGKLHNSRDGLAIFYRYRPRPIQKLCDEIIEGKIKIHDSVIRRMKHGTADYAPGQLPDVFQVVATREPQAKKPETSESQSSKPKSKNEDDPKRKSPKRTDIDMNI
jgi:uncharacterized protein (DUF2235 family)